MVKPVYALVGTDSFMQLEALGKLLQEAGKDAQRLDVDGERAQLADVLDELRSFAMFGGHKVVVLRNGDEFLTRYRESLEKYTASPSNSGTLVMRLSSLPKNQRIYKAIEKFGAVVACEPPENRQLSQWIVQRAKNVHNITLASDAAETLKDLIGADLARLDNELAKLALQSTTGQVQAKDISSTVAFQREQEMWNMTDQIAAGNTAEAVRKWRQLLQMDASAEFRAVTWLTIWLEKVNRYFSLKRQGLGPQAIAGKLKIWPADKVGPFIRTADALGSEGAFRALNLLAQMDYQSKTGVGDAVRNVEKFLLTVNLR